MTVVCVCGNQFGTWRPRCPACGTVTPVTKREPLNTPRISRARVARFVEPLWHECAFCRKRGAKQHRCARCNQPVHAGCQVSHESQCKEFQAQVAALDKEAS